MIKISCSILIELLAEFIMVLNSLRNKENRHGKDKKKIRTWRRLRLMQQIHASAFNIC